MSAIHDLDSLSPARREILRYLKRNGQATIGELAGQAEVSQEAIRRQLIELEKEGWLAKSRARGRQDAPGRPVSHYHLTRAGDQLFGRKYDVMAALLIRTVVDTAGEAGLGAILGALTERYVRRLEIETRGRPLPEKLEILTRLYDENDEFMRAGRDEHGPFLIERNCPFLNVAEEFPRVCSVTVGTLERLTGFRVRRERKFQNGDRCCVFRVLEDRPIDQATHAFAWESEEE